MERSFALVEAAVSCGSPTRGSEGAFDALVGAGLPGLFGGASLMPMDKLGLTGTERIDVLNVKCSPMIIGSLLAGEGFLPAYHMNKGAWISILLDGTVPDGQIEPLLDWSYESAAPKSRRRSLPDTKST